MLRSQQLAQGTLARRLVVTVAAELGVSLNSTEIEAAAEGVLDGTVGYVRKLGDLRRGQGAMDFSKGMRPEDLIV